MTIRCYEVVHWMIGGIDERRWIQLTRWRMSVWTKVVMVMGVGMDYDTGTKIQGCKTPGWNERGTESMDDMVMTFCIGKAS